MHRATSLLSLGRKLECVCVCGGGGGGGEGGRGGGAIIDVVDNRTFQDSQLLFDTDGLSSLGLSA